MTLPEVAPLLSHGDDVLGRYEVRRFIGRGGTGEVYLALHRILGHRVAVKVLHQRDDEDLDRFIAEANAMAAVQHPSLVSIIDSGHVRDLPCIVMNYIDGIALDDLIALSAPFGWNDVLHLLVPTAEALGALHEHGYVHRDIKPANLIVQPGLRPGAVLLDLSIAMNTRLDPRLVQSEQHILGTLGYMSPEQLRGDRVDLRSDIFSFGLVLYECLVGMLPLARRNRQSSFRAAVRGAFVQLPDVVTPLSEPPIPEALRAIVRRCLEVRPDDRFGDGNSLAEALNRVGPIAAFGAGIAHLPQAYASANVSTSVDELQRAETQLHAANQPDDLTTEREPEGPPSPTAYDTPNHADSAVSFIPGAEVVHRPHHTRPRPKVAERERWSRPVQGSGSFLIIPAADGPHSANMDPDQTDDSESSVEHTPAPVDELPAVAATLALRLSRRNPGETITLPCGTDTETSAVVGARIPASAVGRVDLLVRLKEECGPCSVSVTDRSWWFAVLADVDTNALHQRIHTLVTLVSNASASAPKAQWAVLDRDPKDPVFAADILDALRLIRRPSDNMPRVNA